MSEITKANGGDGWSEWAVARLRSGAYEVTVYSNAEKTADGTAKVIHHSEDERDGRRAIDRALSESAAYAHRMTS